MFLMILMVVDRPLPCPAETGESLLFIEPVPPRAESHPFVSRILLRLRFRPDGESGEVRRQHGSQAGLKISGCERFCVHLAPSRFLPELHQTAAEARSASPPSG